MEIREIIKKNRKFNLIVSENELREFLEWANNSDTVSYENWEKAHNLLNN